MFVKTKIITPRKRLQNLFEKNSQAMHMFFLLEAEARDRMIIAREQTRTSVAVLSVLFRRYQLPGGATYYIIRVAGCLFDTYFFCFSRTFFI
jgi:hypothetical protein